MYVFPKTEEHLFLLSAKPVPVEKFSAKIPFLGDMRQINFQTNVKLTNTTK
jgi:hypothetical protein